MTLVLPPRLTASAQSLRDAAHRRGLHTIQLPTFELPTGVQADHLHAGPTFGADLLAGFGHTLPTAIVVDVGVVDGHWAVIEPNAAWASGAYASDPELALDVVLRAAGPTAGVDSYDRQFIRLSYDAVPATCHKPASQTPG